MVGGGGVYAMTDVKFPIYKVSVSWIEDGEHDPESPGWWEGYPDGRVRNGTGWTWMERERDDEAAAVKAWEGWEKYRGEKLAGKNPRLTEFSVKHQWDETWCGGWFSHFTFDTGQSDAEVLASFARYVKRIQKLNREEGHMSNGLWIEKECLMGAEDRWRWTARAEGTGIIGFGETTSDPPCRCDGCKEQGIVRIDH